MNSSGLLNRSSVRRLLAIFGVGVASSLMLAACGGTAAGNPTPTPTRASSAKSPAAAAGITIKTTSIAGLGTVLVNAQGRTLYTLTSESGGKLTCTKSNGCTQSWVEVDLPSGATAVSASGGSQSALLSSETGASGTVVTYNGWPLYTFVGDSKAGQANGEGLQSFGGTWYALDTSGSAVHAAQTHSSPSSSGYSY
ncbi:MAG TPA: hypothetical protein VNH82_09110 [Candidatus Dormibacteraeota bacterium]|nr:hypothetical protein [Candidatus Dormibacteraeota bacterium]